MLLVGTKVGLDEVALNARLPTGVSASLIVNGIAGVGVFTVVTWSGISLIVGAAGPPPTVVTVRLQPPAKLPWSPGPSSNTYNAHAPLGCVPLNVENVLP